jgi:hypothetical protein
MSSIQGRYTGLADVPPVIIPVSGPTYTVSGSTVAFQNI